MKYKGIELKEITESHIKNLPKKMLVWGTSDDEPSKRVVCATAIDNCGNLFFIARQGLKQCNGVVVWKHCAEIPEDSTQKFATNRQLSRWLMEGNGEMAYANGNKIVSDNDYAYGYWSYLVATTNSPVEGVLVRKWEDDDWHEPTLEYMGLDK